jgi:GlpG protein
MRELGTASDRSSAQVLVDYLLTQKIPAVVRDENGRAVIWVQNEDAVEHSTAIWSEFQQNPHDSKYHGSRKTAQELRKLKERADKKYADLYQDAGDFWGRPSPARVPFTMALIIVSIGITLWTQFGKNTKTLYYFTITDRPNPIQLQLPNQLDEEKREQINHRLLESQTECWRRGQWWRLITPIFLHFSILHLAFNMYAVFTLGGLIECRRGPLWMFVFVLVTGIISNLMQFLMPNVFEFNEDLRHLLGSGVFGGMSGVAYAIFGYLMAKTLLAPEPGLKIPSDIIYSMMVWLLVCMTGWIGHIANTAHAVGLIAGFIIGAAPKLIRDFPNYLRRLQQRK